MSCASAPAAGPVRFNRDVRPILSEYCFQCHGPDGHKREADLRLDRAEDARRAREGHAVLVPGKPELSALIARITSSDPDEQMPPASTQRKLTAAQIELLRRWIVEGGEYEPHWSLVPPQRPKLPQVERPGWARQPIDLFVQSRLARERLEPAPEASPETLIRRLSLDLTGLPPTVEEVEEFVTSIMPRPSVAEEQDRDQRSRLVEAAYDALVDRLLASPRYGERMAQPWLDAARYADTNGYQSDGPRFMWRWRDWVIEAFNRNQPFDQFTIEQLAGDLLPDATLEQIIATGFNRNHRGNAEGGIIPEEFRLEYVADRVETTATVWLGLTMGCARCHDHKFDPLTQKDFYQLFAFFNQTPELGKVLRDDNSPPLVKAPTEEMERELARYRGRIEALTKKAIDADYERWIAADLAAWEASPVRLATVDMELIPGLAVHIPLDGRLDLVTYSPRPQVANIPSAPANAASLSLDALPAGSKEPAVVEPRVVDGEPRFVPGRVGGALEFDGRRFVELGHVANFREIHRFSLGAWVKLADRRGGAVVSKMTEDFNHQGYGIHIEDGRVQVALSNRMLDDAMIVESEQTLEPDRWYHLLATYDGAKFASGLRLYIDGQPARTRTVMDLLSNALGNDEPLRIGSRGEEDRFRGCIDDVRLYARELTAEQAAIVATPQSIDQIVAIPAENRTAPQRAKLREYYVQRHGPRAYRDLLAELDAVRQEQRAFEEQLPTVMVMQDGPQRRETHILVRGEYNRPGERVEEDVPACFAPLPSGASRNRLALARWLTSREHPLTARVTVNRYWQMLFGMGLVKTAEDFGSQGELPSHPEVLDWLAVEFMESGWDVKRLLKTIVTSATYRQSSHAGRQSLARDPDNRLLARGARFRLSAEMVRDQALFSSGLLVERLGGPSVKPYQPAGLWEELAANIVPYVQDHGADLYRRSLYTYWKRTVAPPAMMTFDAAGRESCVVRSARTNTPLQALNLLNDVTYVEAARALAARVMTESDDPDERIARLYLHVLSRAPNEREMGLLRASLANHVARYRRDPAAAEQLVKFGETPADRRLDPVAHAALTTLASTVLNLDEAISRE